MQHEFKEGDYVVPLTDDADNNNWNGWILKQRCEGPYIRPTEDPNTRERGNTWHRSGMVEGIDWRYATQSEIQAYTQHCKPCKMTSVPNNLHYEIY